MLTAVFLQFVLFVIFFLWQGFVNFFGAQRFGRDGTNSVDVGILLLRSQWKGAVNRILEPHPADTREVAAAKAAYFEGDGGSCAV